MYTYQKAIFLFRRDLRLDDNTALLAACKQSATVIPCFIFDPKQVGENNPYRSMNAIQFMITSLQDLQKQLQQKKGRLYLFYGEPTTILEQLIKEQSIDALFFNRDYTPFSIARDKKIVTLCKKLNIACNMYDDYLLNAPETVVKKDGNPYSVFTPYWKNASRKLVTKPIACTHHNFYDDTIKDAQPNSLFKKILPETNSNIAQQGGRPQAIAICKKLEQLKAYSKTRDIPACATTELSTHIKFGTLSIREVYWSILEQIGRSAHQGLLRQLYWHDFYYQIAYHWPEVFGSAFHEKYNKLAWSYNKNHFKKWCQGLTGFPIVDAGMRQLNQTGYMHNRVRMIVASFLTKDLLIDWQWGERYFAQQLVDYDPCVNNGNWQWAASTGCDPQPYFRIFNPWLQQKKFDPDCIYIKTWVKELRNVDNKIIHNWFNDKNPKLVYPRPMVDHSTQKESALKMFKNM